MAPSSIGWSVTECVRLAIFAVGNESRGDDALGPRLLRRMESLLGANVVIVADFQLQVEHALDLMEVDLALFIDAAKGQEAPFVFRELVPAPELGLLSHALSPESVLGVFERVTRQPAPDAFVLGISGSRFELGAGLSERAAAAEDAALAFATRLLARPDAAHWRALATAVSWSAAEKTARDSSRG